MSSQYYFPLLFLAPNLGTDLLDEGQFRIATRKWGASIFDLASLATKQKLHLPYQLMDVFLGQCNCEIAVLGEDNLENATDAFNAFRLGLYAHGVSPFLCPFITTHSINEYSGINDRGVESLKGKLPIGMQSGPTIDSISFEAWPLELSLQCIVLRDKSTISPEQVSSAARFAFQWRGVCKRSSNIQAVGEAVLAAPKLLSNDQSLLHIWSGIESLFPTVSSEVSFRVSTYLAQLCATGADRTSFLRRVKVSYGVRSKVSHGSARGIPQEQWLEAWEILMAALQAVVRRGDLPSEDQLIAEMFAA